MNQSVTFVTGHDQSGETPTSLDWQAISKGSQVLVIYMGMKHIVITSVDRDDLDDGGAGQFVKCVKRIRATSPETTIEVLTPADRSVDGLGRGEQWPTRIVVSKWDSLYNRLVALEVASE